MKFLDALKKSKEGWAISSEESGTVYFPEDSGLTKLTKAEIEGVWRVESASVLSDSQRSILIRNIAQDVTERHYEALRRLED